MNDLVWFCILLVGIVSAYGLGLVVGGSRALSRFAEMQTRAEHKRLHPEADHG